MRTLIYKRTHPGDPDDKGRFGIYDCMGRIRRWRFEAVIGVGGISGEPTRHRLAGKVNWIGIGPHKREAGKRGPLVTFDRFMLFKSGGPRFDKLAPQLAKRMYSRNVRALMNRLNSGELREIERILALAKDAPPSPVHGTGRSKTSAVTSAASTRCRPRS
jgi:hypothetical protein